LSKNPLDLSKNINLDDLIDFIIFDEENKAIINPDLYVRKKKGKFYVVQNEKKLFKVIDEIILKKERYVSE
jgi:hypothetical protein